MARTPNSMILPPRPTSNDDDRIDLADVCELADISVWRDDGSGHTCRECGGDKTEWPCSVCGQVVTWRPRNRKRLLEELSSLALVHVSSAKDARAMFKFMIEPLLGVCAGCAERIGEQEIADVERARKVAS